MYRYIECICKELRGKCKPYINQEITAQVQYWSQCKRPHPNGYESKGVIIELYLEAKFTQ